MFIWNCTFILLPCVSTHNTHSAIWFYHFCLSVCPSHWGIVSKRRAHIVKFFHHLVGALPYLTLPYLTLPFEAGVLPPSAEASSGPNAHPRINPKVMETFCRFLQTGGGCSGVPVLGHPFLRNTFQRIHIVSQRWHSSCLIGVSWYLPLLHRVDIKDHLFSLTKWDAGSKCCAQSEGRLIILSPSWTVVQRIVFVCWLLA